MAEKTDFEKAQESRIDKRVVIGDDSFSIALIGGRIELWRYRGASYVTVSFPATVADFNQFDEDDPESWIDVAARIIGGRK